MVPLAPGKGDAADRAVEALYGVPPASFVAARDRLAQQLRAAGQREAAARVKALARPSASAWAVNQAWRDARADVQAMLDAGEALRLAQLDALRRRPTDLRAALATRDKAVARVADLAIEALSASGGQAVTDTVRRRVVSTLDALATSGVPDGVTLGRLTTDLTSTGVDVLAAMAAALPAAPSPPPARSAPRQPGKVLSLTKRLEDRGAAEQARRRDARRELALAELAEAEARLAEADRQRDQAESQADQARVAARAAREAVAALEARLSQAREAVAAARRREEEADTAREQAQRAHFRAAGAVETARRRLAASSEGHDK